MSKLKIAVLASGNATDLDGLLKAINSGEVKAEVSVLVSNKPNSGALKKAKANSIHFALIESKEKQRETFDREVIKVLKQKNIDIILLLGWMRILGEGFCKEFENKIMNIHPSLLPAFAGGMDTDVHKQVLDLGVKVTGCTLHFVTPQVDEGPIILQKAVLVSESDTPESLKTKIQKAEQEVIVSAVKLFSQGRIVIENGKVKILPKN